MTVKELSEAINEGRIITYDGAPYKCIGYQMLRKSDGAKLYSAGLLDMRNERTVVWVDMRKI